MIKNFKFFHGITGGRLTAVWTPQAHIDYGLNVEQELTRLLSDEIAQQIDNEIIDTLTRRINGGNTDWGYIRRWMEIGDQRA